LPGMELMGIHEGIFKAMRESHEVFSNH